MAESGIYFVVAHQEIDYKFPARYADTLEIDTRLTRVATAKTEYAHEVRNQRRQVVCTAKVVLVCVDKTIRPQAIPQDIRQKLEKG
jgi:acyl-CoA thioester hydrolase